MKNTPLPRSTKLLATLPALVGVGQLHGEIIYTGTGPGGYFSDGGIWFNFINQDFTDSPSSEYDWSFAIYEKGFPYTYGNITEGTYEAAVTENAPYDLDTIQFAEGALIDDTSDYDGNLSDLGANWDTVTGTPGYAGYRFESGGETYYGWAYFSVEQVSDFDYTLTLYGFAYDDTGAAIKAGDGTPVPEPGETAALLGLAAAGSAAAFAARRRRKAAKSA
ncbi:PEP-CTERM sorting domain-containing protein [Ruficoccus amylovorans]|uniref:PEP-CTERM sorting domain-containing protein n=1 Tax=Ruficoccus amylovorans TaxID=1804625 RepID=A0A842HGP2_9BACT|nr:PEP-CTERM sorting domain-containing protein [Ruficoccus amylovorans]MBC2595693.1 PEP-CTERM sorting domain-containing protein [Ruficoccus amylovorans]